MSKLTGKSGKDQAPRRPTRKASAPAAPAEARRNRGERRKRETRKRLMRSALGLMAERGMYGVAINEITEAADVGFGSFYNHFESKEAIHAALVDEVFTRFAEALSHISEVLDDPAEILAASIRTVALRGRKDPVWGRFLVRSMFSVSSLGGGMGRYLVRDIERGIEAGRFRTEDLLATALSVAGAVLFAIDAELEFSKKGSAGIRVAKQLGLETENIAERSAAATLRFLGVPPAEAEAIARRPLPEIDLPPGTL